MNGRPKHPGSKNSTIRPRFSVLAPVLKESTTKLPSGLTRTVQASRSVELSNPQDPLSLTKQTDTITVNGKTSTTLYEVTAQRERKRTHTSASGRSRVEILDEKGRVIEMRIPGLVPVQYSYNSQGQLMAITEGARTTTFSYNPQGLLAATTDPLGRTTSYEYDASGRVIKQTLADGREIHFSYDASGNLTSLTPPTKPSHAFAYTPLNQQSEYLPPPVGSFDPATRYFYDADGRLSRVERPDGQAVEFSYNSEGKLSTITSPLGATSFSYDLKGRLSAITTPDGQQLQYDYDGFLEKKVTFSGSIQASLERVYDSDFKVTQLKLNGQLLAGFSFDDDGLLVQAGPLSITRDPQTGFWLSSQAGVVQESRSFDSYGQLQSQEFKVSGGLILKITYERDNLGRITAKTEERPSGITRFEYGYDQAGRLVSETKILPDGSSLVTQWSYDGNGNRVMEVKPNGTVVTGSYDDQDRLLQYGDLSFTYTANGELISKCQGSVCQYFDYDVFGNLRYVILDNGMEIEYVIDGRNRRIGKKINGTLVQGFIYDDQLRIVAELDGSNQVVSRFIYADHINVPEIIEKGGRTYRILHDHLGSPRFVIDTQTGEIAQELHYDAWGNVVFDSNPGFQPFGFAGGLYDPHTKLVRFGARDYDPQVGRWMSKDPLLFGGAGPNLFCYSVADPVNLVDSNGLACGSPCPDYPPGCGEPPQKRDGRCPKCDPGKIRASLQEALQMYSWYARGGSSASEAGTAGGSMQTVAGVKCKRRVVPELPPGWHVYVCSWPPSTFNCSGDPCVDFCVCVHEWFHVIDRRPHDLLHWSQSYIERFYELPAYATEIECLNQYL
ncbi:MAG: RHS repeat domain-containing protein [Acidobacteriota bacterium]